MGLYPQILFPPACAFCPACNPRGIAPSPTRVLAAIPHAFWGRHSLRADRVLWPPHSSRVLAAIPRACGGATPSRQLSGRSFIALFQAGQGGIVAQATNQANVSRVVVSCRLALIRKRV